MSDSFTCPYCGLSTDGQDRRTHCPDCLNAVHPRDRSRMAPIAVGVPREGEWVLIHRCDQCGELTSTPAQHDDNVLILMRMAVQPLASPPFPLEAFGRL